MADLVIIAAIAAAVFLIVRRELRRLKSGQCGEGCGGCGGSCCGGCSGALHPSEKEKI